MRLTGLQLELLKMRNNAIRNDTYLQYVGNGYFNHFGENLSKDTDFSKLRTDVDNNPNILTSDMLRKESGNYLRDDNPLAYEVKDIGDLKTQVEVPKSGTNTGKGNSGNNSKNNNKSNTFDLKKMLLIAGIALALVMIIKNQ